MADKHYYVHFSGDNLGPISAKLTQKLIQSGRLQASDYAAAVGTSDWTKLCDIPEFESLFPTAPRAAVPAQAAPQTDARPASKPVAAAPAPEPKAAKAAPAPKTEPAPPPAPKAAPKPEPKPLQGVVTIGKKMFKIVEVRQAGLLLEANGDLEEGSEVQMQISGQSFPKPFEMKAILIGKEAYQGTNVFMTEFVRPNPAHKRTLAPYIAGDDKD